METQDKELQEMPYACKKSQLQAWYLASGLTEREIRIGINAIIADNRGLGPNHTVANKTVRHAELKEFVKIYGLPKGYKHGKHYES